MTSPTKADWLEAIKSLGSIGVAWTDASLAYEAPQFTFGDWCICAEKITDFQSLVFRSAEPGLAAPPCPAGAFPVTERKEQHWNWLYRVKPLLPNELRGFLENLRPRDALAVPTGPAFEAGKIYNRQADIHAHFGGQTQGGISTPADRPAIFLFTGKSGERWGYADEWAADGVLRYVGEGQSGDMQFTKGNLAIRDHSGNGKALYLFESQGKGKGYRYVGEFVCSTWDYGVGPDGDGQQRQTIIFHLVPESAANGAQADPELPQADLATLREQAIAAASPAARATETTAKKTVYERSRAVAAYVLARAKGLCECCGSAAPFTRANGTPYLEPHHTRRVSDGGPDHPRWVAAVCPNCHREVHHGQNGKERNAALVVKLGTLEP